MQKLLLVYYHKNTELNSASFFQLFLLALHLGHGQTLNFTQVQRNIDKNEHCLKNSYHKVNIVSTTTDFKFKNLNSLLVTSR